MSNVVVKDNLPDGTRFISAQDKVGGTSASFSCSQAAGVVTCNGGDFNGSDPDEPDPGSGG